MKRVWLGSIVVIAQFAAGSAMAGNCVEPPAYNDEIPNGSSATRDVMLSTQRSIKAYDNAIKAFADCLRDSGDTSHRGDAAVQKLEALAARFNDQLKAFKERNGAS
ncbi:MAG TPA: hypothetical protein VHZ99_14280 [Steroidobacteraceae bacterium]|jgi:hypothetical protein|nr:hypothetical protein [Steroidobacteraceae bacterium]